MWYHMDRGSVCRLYRVPGYWFGLTLGPYLVVMVRSSLPAMHEDLKVCSSGPSWRAAVCPRHIPQVWKALQLVKLTFGFWDDAMVQAFRIRDKAE